MLCVELPWGWWQIISQNDAIVAIHPTDERHLDLGTELEKEAAKQLQEYAAGQRMTFTVPAATSGTPFQQSVWQELCRIPYGCSVSYGDLARRIGRPTAYRAVAQAVGANPCLVLIPCHRVIGTDGSITGFSAGLTLKRRLLSLEGIFWKE